jgi:hypothetical protein
MGVMLSLDRHRPANGRRRAQHARREDGWARARALATVRRSDVPADAGLLCRLIRVLLPWRDRSAGSRAPGYERDRYRGAEAPPGTAAASRSTAASRDGAAPRGRAAPGGGRDAGRAPAA